MRKPESSPEIKQYIAMYYNQFYRLAYYTGYGTISMWPYHQYGEQSKQVPLAVLNKWVRKGTAIELVGSVLQKWMTNSANTRGWRRRTSMMSYYKKLPYQFYPMQYLNTIAEHHACDPRLSILPKRDYKEHIGVSFARYEKLRLDPKIMPTRKELLYLSSWWRTAIEHLLRPANTNLQDALEKMQTAPQGELLRRALDQPRPYYFPYAG